MQLAIVIIAGPIYKGSQKLLNGISNHQRIAKDTHDFNDRSVQFEVVFNNGNETVSDDGDMYLYSNSILRFSPKGFDTQMLLNPLEKQFNLPSVAVKKGNVFCFEKEVVSVIGESPSKVRSIEYNTPERDRIVFTVSFARESDRLITQDIVISLKHVVTLRDFIIRMRLLPYDIQSSSLLNCVESGEIKVGFIKYIACVPFVDKPVHGIDIMNICIADSVEDRYFRGNINLGMNLNAGLCTSELCPFKDRHTQIDGSGVNGIEPSVEFKLFGYTLGLNNRNNVKRELFKDFRVSKAVGLGKDASIDRNLSKSQVKRSFGVSNSNICEFSKTVAAYELTVHNNKQMTPVRWRHTGGPVFVFDNKTVEVTFGKKLHYLCENIFADVHNCSILRLIAKELNPKLPQSFVELLHCA